MTLNAADLGNILTILQILAILGGGIWFSARMEAKIQLLANAHTTFTSRLDKVDTKLDSLTTVTVQLAKQEERMANQDTRMQELSMRIDTLRFVQSVDPKPSRRKA